MKKTINVDATYVGMRLDRFLRKHFETIPQSLIERSLRSGKIKKTLSKRYQNRKGGYTRVIKAGFRYGDNAPMAVIEFVDRDIEAKKVDKKKTVKSPATDKKTETPKEATA